MFPKSVLHEEEECGGGTGAAYYPPADLHPADLRSVDQSWDEIETAEQRTEPKGSASTSFQISATGRTAIPTKWHLPGCSGIFEQKTHSKEGTAHRLHILGTILVVVGLIWFLQGINVLPGSFMTGQTRWAVYGGIAVVAGIAAILMTPKRRP